MSRCRKISTDISDDKIVARVEKKYGDFAGLLYERMIPHAGDDAIITGDPEELLALVFPHRRDKEVEDIEKALEGIAAEGLIAWDRADGKIYFPTKSFYKYQTYIPESKRRTWEYGEEQRETAKNVEGDAPGSGVVKQSAQISEEQRVSLKNNEYSEELRETAQKGVSPSPSLSPSLSPSVSPSEEPPIPPCGGIASGEGDAPQVPEAPPKRRLSKSERERREKRGIFKCIGRLVIPNVAYRQEWFEEFLTDYPKIDNSWHAAVAWDNAKVTEEIMELIRAALLPFRGLDLSMEAKSSITAPSAFLNETRWTYDDPFQGYTIYRKKCDADERRKRAQEAWVRDHTVSRPDSGPPAKPIDSMSLDELRAAGHIVKLCPPAEINTRLPEEP